MLTSVSILVRVLGYVVSSVGIWGSVGGGSVSALGDVVVSSEGGVRAR